MGCCLDLREYASVKSETRDLLEDALQDVVDETELWAKQYESDGRYKDAAYLHGRIHHDMTDRNQIVAPLAAVYEKIGDYPAAELARAKKMRIILDVEGDPDGELLPEIEALSRLLNLFHTRLQVLGSASQTYARLSIVCRAAKFDLEQLNTALFDQGLIELDYFDQLSISSLHIAVKENAPNLARLLHQKGADLNLKDDSGDTPLHIAVKNGTEEVLKLLLDWGADTEIRDLKERTSLGNAIDSGLPSSAQILIRHGADVNATRNTSNNRGMLLFEAARQGKEWAAILSLENGANPQATDGKGQQDLYYAIGNGQESMVKVLLDHGGIKCLIDDPMHGHTLLHLAVLSGNLTIVEMILKAGADTNKKDHRGSAPLHDLIVRDPAHLVQIVGLLLKFGAQVNIGNHLGNTPLHVAANFGRLEVVRMLLDAAADPQLENTSGETALSLAQKCWSLTLDPRFTEILQTLNSHVAAHPRGTSAGY